VVAELVRDPAMKGADIEVTVEHGQVTLDGKAKDSSQADHARQVAENLAGSGKVTAKLSASG
jgi:osmotically-inducible protein OsmY